MKPRRVGPASGSSTGRSRFRAELVAKVWLPLALVATTVLLGWVGFHDYYRAIGQPIPVTEALFHAAGLPLQETAVIDDLRPEHIPPVLQLARILGLFVIPYAFVLAFVALFGRLTRPLRIRSWSWRLRRRDRGHSVVFGLGVKGQELVRDLVASGARVAAVERDADHGFIPAASELGAVVIVGDATQAAILRSVNIAAADNVFVVADSDETNVRIVKEMASLLGRTDAWRGAIECSVEITEPRTREFLQRAVAGVGSLSIRSFDTYETTARQLLDAYPLTPPGSTGTDEARLVLLGWSPMGRAVLKQALLLGHFRPGRAFRIRVVAEDAEAARADFLRQYPCFVPGIYGDDPDVERFRQQVMPQVEFVELPRSDTLLLRESGQVLESIGPGAATLFCVCLDDGLRSAAHLSTLLPAIDSAATAAGTDARALYYYNYPEDEHWLLVQKNLREIAPAVDVHAFGNFLEGCSVDRVQGRPADELARQIAAFYRQQFGSEPWAALSEADRMANRRAADHLRVKVHSIGAELVDAARADPDFAFSDAEIVLLSEIEHRAWSAEKLLSGWRPLPRTPQNLERWRRDKQGLKAQKLHIDLVPFEQLADEDRDKDRSQILGIPRFARTLGLGIRRCPARPGDRGPAVSRLRQLTQTDVVP